MIKRTGPREQRSRRTGAYWIACVVLLGSVVGVRPPAAASDTWVMVDTAAATLAVMRGDRLVASFDDISIGRGGASRERRVNDQKTPLGEFRIAKIKEDSIYHRFFIIDYPDEARARRALERGEIDRATFRAIREAANTGRMPPQNTPLGGNLGIHGLGGGDPEIHEAFNWTLGCIALTNEQIDRLARWLHVGTRVVVD